MNRLISYILFISLFTLLLDKGPFAHAKEEPICPHIVVQDGTLRLNDNERVLVCGSDAGVEGWKTIPIPQAILILKSIAQSQGYLAPRFERNGDSLKMWLGPKTEIASFVIHGADRVLDAGKKRKIVGHPLEPAKLNEVEEWANAETRRQGYACASVAVEAHEWDAEVVANVKLGTQKRFGKFILGDLDGLNPDVLNRYRPFEEGDVYNIRETQLLTTRLLADGLFQSAYISVQCQDSYADLKLETSIGKPKIFRFGVGGSTEELPFADASFKNARLDSNASSFTIVLHGSPRKYSFSFGSELYWIPGSTRSFLGPRIELARRSESAFETNTASSGIDIGRNWDWKGIRLNGRWGPTLNYSKRISGAGPEEVFYPTIDGSLTLASHAYESSIRDQYEGWNAQFYYRGQSTGLGSNVDVNRYRLDIKSLWNIGGFSPPLFVFGSRFEGIIVDTDEITGANRDLLPVEDRIYLGGDQNLRGFGRQSINNGGLGYLTSLYLGFELRMIDELPYHLQPFLLLDAAQIGNRRFSLERPVLTSYGFGIRWASPVGTIRATYARGNIIGSDASTSGILPGSVLFASWGQEF